MAITAIYGYDIHSLGFHASNLLPLRSIETVNTIGFVAKSLRSPYCEAVSIQ